MMRPATKAYIKTINAKKMASSCKTIEVTIANMTNRKPKNKAEPKVAARLRRCMTISLPPKPMAIASNPKAKEPTRNTM